MAGVDVLARLCAGSTRYHSVGGRCSAGGQLSRAELAGLMSGLDAQGMNLALAKYLCDVDAERLLMAHVQVKAAGLAVAEGWVIQRGRPCVLNMSAVAVLEVVRPNVCRRCQGTRYVHSKVCCRCQGAGLLALSGRDIAEAVGVDESTFRRLWRPRYDRLYEYVQAIDSRVKGCVRLNAFECA